MEDQIHCKLTQFVSKIIVTFEYFNQMVQHAKIYRNFGKYFLEHIDFILRRYVQLLNVGVSEAAVGLVRGALLKE